MNERKTIISPIQRLLGEDFNPALLFIMIRKSLLWCAVILLATTSAALIYLRYTPPNYEVDASLIVKSINTAQALDIENKLFQAKNSNLDIEKDIQIMKSNVIIDRVIDSLPLEISYYRSGNILNEELYKNNPFAIHASVNDPALYDRNIWFRFLSNTQYQLDYSEEGASYKTYEFGKTYHTPELDFSATLKSSKTGASGHIDKEGDYFFTINNRNTLYNSIRDALQIAPSAPTIGILMRDRKPQKAADLVNKVCDEFIQYDKEKKTESATLILNFIEAQVDSISNDLRSYEDQMINFKLTNGISIGTLEQDVSIELKALKDEQGDVNLDFSNLEFYRKYFLQYQDSARLLTGIVDPQYQALNDNIKKLDDLQTLRKQTLLKLTPNNPELINLDQQIVEVKHNLLESISHFQSKVRQKSGEIEAEIAKYMGDYSNVPGIQAEYLRLSRLSDLKEKYYLLMLDKKSAFSITKAGFVSDYTVLRRADIPLKPISPNSPLIKLMGLVSGLLACLSVIIIRYLLHHRILSVEEINRYCDAAILGVIPKHQHTMDVSQLVVNKNPKSVISECFRSMRTNLEYISPGKAPQMMAVTSTVAGEGKTFIAVNMAGIMAVGGKKVILLDFDLRKPQIHKAFNVDNHTGVSTLLIGKHNLNDCIRHSEWENLDFITSGPLPPNPAEFIASQKTDDIIKALKEQYDVLVVDTPPVGMVTDALQLLKRADMPVYILRADYSSRNFLNNVNYLVKEHDVKKLSIVLNDMGEGASIYAYSYGYGYGYGGYGSQEYGYDYYTDDVRAKRGLLGKMTKFIRSFF
jgi:capsular exopolysaccharide synthesis family protein